MALDGPAITAGSFYASFLFDVADTIDLKKLGRIAGESAEPAPLRMRTSPSPEHIQFAVPPLAANLASVTVGGHLATVRVKIYDYGVISVRFAFSYSGTWFGFAEMAIGLRRGDQMANEARRLLAEILADCGGALGEPHDTLLEDYFTCAVEELAQPLDAATLLADFKPAIVGLMMAETRDLSPDEQAEVLRLRFSYFPEDLVVLQWDCAFILDTRENALVLLDLFEFANSQLVEFRTYDAQLDDQIDMIYGLDTTRRVRLRPLHRREAEQRADRLGYLLVDVRELSDRAGNALKIIGDAYYARVYRAVGARLGLDVWQREIQSKLDSVGEVYRYLIDQAQASRSEFLELIVIALIGIEIVVGVLGLLVTWRH
jgi:hypothetical protein